MGSPHSDLTLMLSAVTNSSSPGLNMSSSTVTVYFELSWSILSSIGLIVALIGLMVIGITNLSPLSILPVIVSVSSAVANGLCYYAFYAHYSKNPRVIAAAFADIMWLIQEAGLSFYSYQILQRLLKGKVRVTFLSVFWTLMAAIFVTRLFILINRAKGIIEERSDLQSLVNSLHIGYFVSIALVETWSALFLIRIFTAARKASMVVFSKTGIFRELTRSAETRLATLCLIGITRAITYSFQTSAQSATSVWGEVDRFAYTLECLFPVVMIVDFMASKITAMNGYHRSSNRSNVGNERGRPTGFLSPHEGQQSGMDRHSFILLEHTAPQPLQGVVTTTIKSS